MQRFAFWLFQVAIDVVLLAAAFSIAFLVRCDGTLPPQMTKRLLFLLPYVVAFEYAVLVVAGVHRFVWRYVSLPEVIRIAGAVGAGSMVLLAIRVAAGEAQHI
jgi:FlaA1/EpsC-like NDP-sugar epimerase